MKRIVRVEGDDKMCYCPIAKEHCTNGRVESHPNDECEFWDNEKSDCRIRRVLALLQLSLKLEEGHLK